MPQTVPRTRAFRGPGHTTLVSLVLVVLCAQPAVPLAQAPPTEGSAWQRALTLELDGSTAPPAPYDPYHLPSLHRVERADPWRTSPASSDTWTPPPEGLRCYDHGAIRDLPFGLDHADYPLLVRELELFCGPTRSLLAGWMARAGRFRPLIEAELRRQNAPPELIWVVALESAFEPSAVSRAGAAGLWQFMPQTARGRGMRVDRWLDQRFDFDHATRHGIAYLMELRERFGHWGLALAAYNAGPGHVAGHLRRASVNDFFRLHDYQAVYAVSRRYALRIFAMAIIDRHREVFGLEGLVEEPTWAWETVHVEGGLRLALVAQAAGVPLETLQQLNPALRRAQIPAELPTYPLRLPVGSALGFVERLDRLAERYGRDHEVIHLRFGETPEDVAARLGIPARVLRATSGLPLTGPVPYDSVLLAPLRGRQAPRGAAAASSPIVIVPARSFYYPGRDTLFYVVRPGDRAVDIAAALGVSLHDLVLWNDLDPQATLLGGMVLQAFVPCSESLRASVVFLDPEEAVVFLAGSPELSAYRENQRPQRARVQHHTVRSGETLSGVAQRYGVSVRDLRTWNGLGADSVLRPGQRLVVRR